MQKFPSISEEQVVLIRADALNGHILCEDFSLAKVAEENVYTVFENYKAAIEYVNVIIKGKETIEAVIYDNKQNVIYYFNPVNGKD